jgi:hypothetical protein
MKMRNQGEQLLTSGSFKNSLRARSQQRRSKLKRVAAQVVPSLRNDILPKLELVQLAIKDISIPRRNVRKAEESHLQEIMASLASFACCTPPVVNQDNIIIDAAIRVEAARRLNIQAIGCIRICHLDANEERLLRVALNRLGEKGSWAFEELKLELNELVLENTPIEITGFTRIDIDQINLDVEPAMHEAGPLAPEPNMLPASRLGDVFELGDHVLGCGDSTVPDVIKLLMSDAEARLILTDQPYNCRIAGNVTTKPAWEFVMAAGELSAADFQQFNKSYLSASLPFLCEGGLFGTFIDWRGYASIVAVAVELELEPINLVVWAKSDGGLGSLYRSQHELLPLFKKGGAAHVNNVDLRERGRCSATWIWKPGFARIIRCAPFA